MENASTQGETGYLPLLEANPTQISRVNVNLKKSISMADKLGLLN